jgi:hypothetical protein
MHDHRIADAHADTMHDHRVAGVGVRAPCPCGCDEAGPLAGARGRLEVALPEADRRPAAALRLPPPGGREVQPPAPRGRAVDHVPLVA